MPFKAFDNLPPELKEALKANEFTFTPPEACRRIGSKRIQGANTGPDRVNRLLAGSKHKVFGWVFAKSKWSAWNVLLASTVSHPFLPLGWCPILPFWLCIPSCRSTGAGILLGKGFSRELQLRGLGTQQFVSIGQSSKFRTSVIYAFSHTLIAWWRRKSSRNHTTHKTKSTRISVGGGRLAANHVISAHGWTPWSLRWLEIAAASVEPSDRVAAFRSPMLLASIISEEMFLQDLGLEPEAGTRHLEVLFDCSCLVLWQPPPGVWEWQRNRMFGLCCQES